MEYPDRRGVEAVLGEIREAGFQRDPLSVYTLAEIREVIEAAADLTRRVRELEDDIWLDAEGASEYLGWGSAASLAKSDAPRRYLTPRVIRYHKKELRKWAEAKPRL